MPAFPNLERRLTSADKDLLDRLVETNSEVVEELRSTSASYRFVSNGLTILGTVSALIGTHLLFNDAQPFNMVANYFLSAASYLGAWSIGRMGAGFSEYAGKVQGEAQPLVFVLQ